MFKVINLQEIDAATLADRIGSDIIKLVRQYVPDARIIVPERIIRMVRNGDTVINNDFTQELQDKFSEI